MNKTIDFHHDATPPEYIKILNKYGLKGNTGVKFKKFDPVKNLNLIKVVERLPILTVFYLIITNHIEIGLSKYKYRFILNIGV